MDYFKLFHGGKNLKIIRNETITDIKICFFSPDSENQYKEGLHLKKNEVLNKWDVYWKNNEFHEFISHIVNEVIDKDDFINFVIDNLSYPYKNPLKVKRFEDKKIEALLVFFKVHKEQMNAIFNGIEFIDDPEKNEFQDCIMNQVNMVYYENSLEHYNIDERLVSPKEVLQYQIWNICDLPPLSDFSVMGTLVDEKPFYFIMDGEGGLFKIKNILNLLYCHCYIELPYISTDENLEELKNFLYSYDKFLKEKELYFDEDKVFHDENDQLVFMESLNWLKDAEQDKELMDVINAMNEHYLISMEDNDGYIDIGIDERKKVKIDDFLPLNLE